VDGYGVVCGGVRVVGEVLVVYFWGKGLRGWWGISGGGMDILLFGDSVGLHL